MKLVPIKVEKIHKQQRSDNYKILKEFTESGMQCAEIRGYTQKLARYCQYSLTCSIRRYRFQNVKSIRREDRVYLVRLTFE